MTRHDYRQSSFERIIGRRPRFTVPAAMYAPLVAVAVAALLVAAVYVVELQRCSDLDAQLAALHERIAVAQRADAHVDDLSRSVAQLRDVRRAVIAARRETLIAANTIARIGNRLPSETWLTSVQTNRAGSWSIAGRSTRVDQIGTTLAAIGDIDRTATTRLVSIDATGRTGRLLNFVIAWEHPQ